MLIRVLLILFLLFKTSMAVNAEPKIEDIQKYAELTMLLLNELSSNWSYKSLGKHIHPIGYEGNEDLFKKMTKKSSHLGKYKNCPSLSVGIPKNLDIKGAKALTGKCIFENGEATITVVFLKLEKDLDIFSFVISEQSN